MMIGAPIERDQTVSFNNVLTRDGRVNRVGFKYIPLKREGGNGDDLRYYARAIWLIF